MYEAGMGPDWLRGGIDVLAAGAKWRRTNKQYTALSLLLWHSLFSFISPLYIL
jgi:hypothetical protein